MGKNSAEIMKIISVLRDQPVREYRYGRRILTGSVISDDFGIGCVSDGMGGGKLRRDGSLPGSAGVMGNII